MPRRIHGYAVSSHDKWVRVKKHLLAYDMRRELSEVLQVYAKNGHSPMPELELEYKDLVFKTYILCTEQHKELNRERCNYLFMSSPESCPRPRLLSECRRRTVMLFIV